MTDYDEWSAGLVTGSNLCSTRAITDVKLGRPDAGKMGIANARHPAELESVPYAKRPIAVEVRVLWERASIDPREEWIPAVAARWTDTYVCVHVPDPRSYWAEFWVPATDVRRRD